MEEQLREYILFGNMDEKQFLIGDQVITVNPKKTQEQIEKEIEEEIQSVFSEENYLKIFLDNKNKKNSITTYYLLMFIRYLLNLKKLVEERGFERHKDQVDNCQDMVEKILGHLRICKEEIYLKQIVICL